MVLEDKTASSESSEQRRDQNDVRFDVLNMGPSLNTLFNSFRGDVTIKEIWVVFDSEEELLVFTEFFPDVGEVVFNPKFMGGDV